MQAAAGSCSKLAPACDIVLAVKVGNVAVHRNSDAHGQQSCSAGTTASLSWENRMAQSTVTNVTCTEEKAEMLVDGAMVISFQDESWSKQVP